MIKCGGKQIELKNCVWYMTQSEKMKEYDG